MGPVWAICVYFVYTGLLIWAFPQVHRLNLTYCLKSSQLLAFCFLLVCMIDYPTQRCPSLILPLGPFQGIICNIERGNLELSITRGTQFKRGNLRSLFIPWLFHKLQFHAISGKLLKLLESFLGNRKGVIVLKGHFKNG